MKVSSHLEEQWCGGSSELSYLENWARQLNLQTRVYAIRAFVDDCLSIEYDESSTVTRHVIVIPTVGLFQPFSAKVIDAHSTDTMLKL